MPLVHRWSGTGFATRDADSPTFCKLCAARASTFDLSMRCCLDRYESLFGSVYEHRSKFAHARISALDGDFMPARRLVESYRRVFGPMAAVELKRTLWQSINEAQGQPLRRSGVDQGEQPRSAA
jgi:hypothetical protein